MRVTGGAEAERVVRDELGFESASCQLGCPHCVASPPPVTGFTWSRFRKFVVSRPLPNDNVE
jgi:hypothetical protein